VNEHPIITKAQWVEARRALLAKEKELTRLRDRLAAEQRALPWVKVEKSYVFDGPTGKVTLAELFDGRSQLFVKHFMMGPGSQTQCVGCSFQVDHIEGILAHLNNHDVTYAVVARAPIEEIEVVRKRMGWKFPWVSSYGSDFNYDFDVSFTPDQVSSGFAPAERVHRALSIWCISPRNSPALFRRREQLSRIRTKHGCQPCACGAPMEQENSAVSVRPAAAHTFWGNGWGNTPGSRRIYQ
jgi:hypothetical protein